MSNENDLKLFQNKVSADKKPSRGGWNAAIFIIFVEVAERFAFYGLAGNLITYLTNELHQSIATAAKNVNTWIGVSFVVPLLGALVADSFLGRFKTIIYSSIIYFLGMVMLCLSVSIVPRHYQEAVFFVGLYILAIGEGGQKPCIQTFAADQFEEDSPEQKKAKSSFFNWWYLGIVNGAGAAMLVVSYTQDNVSWAVGFAILAAAMLISLVIFILGIKRYQKQSSLGSPLSTVARVLVAVAKKWRLESDVYYENEDSIAKTKTLARTDQFRFLDKAMLIDHLDASMEARNPWRLCSRNEVEEVKLLLRLIPIWLCCLSFAVVQSFLSTFFPKQGSTMIRSIGSNFKFPMGSLQIFTCLTSLVAIPIYDRAFVPKARKITGHSSGITSLQRICIGLFLTIIAMVVSATVEAKRVRIAVDHNLIDHSKATVPMRVWWLIPQYMLCGLCDVFTLVGIQELFYNQMPETMRSFGAAAYISVLGVGNFLSTLIVSVVQAISSKYGEEWLNDNLNRSHLDYFYWVIAALNALNLCVYLWIAKSFVYKKLDGEESNREMELA